MHLKRMTLLLCCLALGALPALATASPADAARQQATIVVAQRDGPSLSDAVKQVRRQYNGRIVSASTEVRGNREIHVIKVLTEDGKLKTVRIQGGTRGNRT